MHADGIGNGLEVERPQVLNAVSQKTVLLAHDLRCHFQNGLGTLIEALHQPVGGLHAIGQIAALGLVAGIAGDGGEIGLVDQDTRQGVGVQFHRPAPSEAGRTSTSGTMGCTIEEP